MSTPLSSIASAEPTTSAVLIVRQQADDSAALATVLQAEGHRVVLVTNAVDANEELGRREFTAVVCELANGDPSQIKTLTGLRSQALNTATPLLLLLPSGADHALAMRLLGPGIVDCIVNPIDDFVLRSKVKLFAELQQNRRKLQGPAVNGGALLIDTLTGLPNRFLFVDRADQAMRQAARNGTRVAVASMDLEQIEEVKETLGPATGDELTRQIALRLTGALRRSDTVARIGPTTFGVVLACDTRDGVQTVTARLDRIMADAYAVGGHRITLGGGIGVALFPEHGRESAVLIERAAAAMAVAKRDCLGHLFFDAIQSGDAEDADRSADTAEMNADELLKVSAA